MKRFFLYLLLILLILSIVLPLQLTKANVLVDIIKESYVVTLSNTPIYLQPDSTKDPISFIYGQGDLFPSESINGWAKVKIGYQDYWIPEDKYQARVNQKDDKTIIDLYGIMDQPHTYAIKLVKFPDAKGRIETYKKTEDGYKMQKIYSVSYPKAGPKDKYGDLKTVGGPVIRYIYRTTRSSMNGRSEDGDKFGVYKVSFPMPHDALPHVLDGNMSLGRYNQFPIINYKGNQLFPHPPSLMGADILIHTKNKGSLGCIMVENEEMNYMYHEDLPTLSNTEIIPMVIYDEDMEAPQVGKLF